MKYIRRIFNLEYSELVAFWYYYFSDRKLKCTSFIDEVSFSYGFGKLNGAIGVFEYQLPFWFTKKFEK